MKIQIDLTEEQLDLMINALEVTFRIMMKQGSIVADLLAEMPFKKDFSGERQWERAFDRYLIERDVASKLMTSVADVLYGDYTNRLPEDAHRYSDIWSALRHLQYELHPHDGYDTRAYKPFALSDYPMMIVELVER